MVVPIDYIKDGGSHCDDTEWFVEAIFKLWL